MRISKRRGGIRSGYGDEILRYGSAAELRGRGELTVFGCRKILKYETDEIVLRVIDSRLSIRGVGLICTTYFAECIGISGRIDALEFSDEELGGDER